MSLLQRIASLWSAYLGACAAAAALLVVRYATKRRILLVETPGQGFLFYPEGGRPAVRINLAAADASATDTVAKLLRGSHATIRLDPGRFVFRTLDLPRRAAEFLDAIVRTQIDRLTPWTADQALFGWGRPTPHAEEDKIALVVAATDKALVAPLLQRVQEAGAATTVASVPAPNALADDPDIVVAEIAAAAFAIPFWRRWLAAIALLVVAIVAGSTLYSWLALARLERTAGKVEAVVAAKRAALMHRAAADPLAEARRVLEQRKREAPFVTLVLETLSRILPDDTYVTEFEVDGTRLRIVGLTADAPALIRLIEGSGLFANPVLFAPTTRLPEDSADRFNIEATIRPNAKTSL